MDSKNDKNDRSLLSFELTQNEANIIIEGLGCLPFKDVYKIIEKIHVQANSAQNRKKNSA